MSTIRRGLMFAAVLLVLATKNLFGQQLGIFYPNIPGELLLANDKVVVQKFILEPGEWEGLHTHPGNQVYVHIRGGEWTVRRNGQERVSHAADGSVGWSGVTTEDEQHESGNTGDTPIELVWVTLQPCTPLSNHHVSTYYPNIPGEVLLENDRVVVQRFIVEPGQWEGYHSHPGNQVYVTVRGGVWSGRRNGIERIGTQASQPGRVGWMRPVPLSEQHNSGNTGDTPIELIWITLKPCERT
jgi:mannose-6-phosphate isomerase-like protein (cupin superfamily)